MDRDRPPSTEKAFKSLKENVQNDPFWVDQPSILFNSQRAIEFYPTQDMTTIERLNAVSRFFIYLGIVLWLVFRNYKILFIPIIALSILYLIYLNDQRVQQINIEKFDQSIKNELGIKENTPILVDDMGDICQRPTRDNPFMNVLLTDILDNPHRPPACYLNDPQIKEESDQYFNYNLYKNVGDIWEKRNSQRQYYTNPSTTIPNDRDSFMKWCWKTTNVCRDGDLDYCLKYEDPRYT